MTPKSDFALIGAETITPKGSMNTEILEKRCCSLSKIMSIKQVNKSTNDLRSILEETYEICMARLRKTNLHVFIQRQYTRTILRNKNMGQSQFKKHSKFQNFDEIFYCDMTRLKNTNFDVFMQCQYTRTILRNKNTR